jgi:tRNA A37 threonylcarbamoyladenosine biosynthesis protein TsaE
MAKRKLKVGKFYHHKMFTSDVYVILKIYEHEEIKMKVVSVYKLDDESNRTMLYDRAYGDLREVTDGYWKNI